MKAPLFFKNKQQIGAKNIPIKLLHGATIKQVACPVCNEELGKDKMGVLRCYNKKCDSYLVTANVEQPIDRGFSNTSFQYQIGGL